MNAGRVIVPFVAAGSLLYLPKLFVPHSALYRDVLTAPRMLAIGGAAKLACLAIGAVYGFRSAARFEPGNPARLPWFLFGLWLAAFAVGQAGLMWYALLLGIEAPLPSFGDAAFVLGYPLMIAGALRFLVVYRSSGFPVGSGRQHAAIAAVTALVLAGVTVVTLVPIVRADVPMAERLINLAYPTFDVLALVPTVVLLRIAWAFRPGKVWTVWSALLVGFVFMAVGDICFAYLSSIGKKDLDPLVDLTFLVGYFFAGVGMKLQHELLG